MINKTKYTNELPSINGVLLIDKDSDMTSHDVVNIARKKLNIRKIGHCGTLDPMATGLLMLVIGKGTKLQDLLMSENKVYEGIITLGETTDTQDAEGKTINKSSTDTVSAEEIKEIFSEFKGNFQQIPPMVSAKKVKGVPLYKLARKGIEVERKPRDVTIFNYSINNIEIPLIDFTIKCSKGFYVRTYAHDIGEKLKVGAHLSKLRRTASGTFNVKDAISINDLKNKDFEYIKSKVKTLQQVSYERQV